jgi:hypothetical protein
VKQVRLGHDVLRSGLHRVSDALVPGYRFALVDVPIGELAHSLGLELEQSFDGLDYVDVAVVELPSGKRTAFMRHSGGPEDQTEVWLPEASADLWDTLRKEASIGEEAVVWRADTGEH